MNRLRGLGGLTSSDTVVSLVVPPRAADPMALAGAIESVREGFARHSSGPCDVIVLAVPSGKGEPYVDEMANLVEQSPGSRLILPPGV
jgi:prephenate dehydrogenase